MCCHSRTAQLLEPFPFPRPDQPHLLLTLLLLLLLLLLLRLLMLRLLLLRLLLLLLQQLVWWPQLRGPSTIMPLLVRLLYLHVAMSHNPYSMIHRRDLECAQRHCVFQPGYGCRLWPLLRYICRRRRRLLRCCQSL